MKLLNKTTIPKITIIYQFQFLKIKKISVLLNFYVTAAAAAAAEAAAAEAAAAAAAAVV